MLRTVRLAPDDCDRLRGIRLAALEESPAVFLAEYAVELGYEPDEWQAELKRGDWYIGLITGRPVGLLGVTREPDMPKDERYLEYMWVHPDHRHAGIATKMVRTALASLKAVGVRTVYLWVLDGNKPAFRLYESLGFRYTGEKVSDLADYNKPGRSEEQMALDLEQMVLDLG